MKPNLENDRFFLRKVKSGKLRVTRKGEVFNTETGNQIGTKGNKYLGIGLKDPATGKVRHILVHRLVFLVFHGLLKQDELVNHKDFDTHNNRASNLERSSYQHNRSYSEQRGRYAILQSEGFSKKIRGIVRKSHRARLTMKKAREIRKAYADGVGVEELAAKYGCGLTTIWDVIKNKTWIKV